MKKSEAAQLLAWCAAFDQRTIGDADVLAWSEALSSPWVPNLGLEEAQAAVTAHYQATAQRIAPADILKRVKDTRALNMARALPKAEGVPPNDDWQQARIDPRLTSRKGRDAALAAQEQLAESRRERHAELDGSAS